MRRRLEAGLAAGALSISLNILALKLADAISLPTAHGGLLRLIGPWLAPFLQSAGIPELWHAVGAPGPHDSVFQIAFHVLVGLLMALLYAFVLEPLLPGRAWVKGLIYAVIVWLLNAACVLPATGEGFAGSAHLSLAGMAWFAAAHTLFFVALAVFYARFMRERAVKSLPALGS
jgi:hypothetical protein